jgi:hypothetical protein
VVLVEATTADFTLKPKGLPARGELPRAFVAAHGRGQEVANVATFRELVLVPGMRIAVNGGVFGFRSALALQARR